MFIGRALEHDRAQLLVHHVERIGEIGSDLLLDGAAFVFPVLVEIVGAGHARGFDVKGNIEIVGRNGEEILRHALACIRVEVAAHHCADRRELVGREPRAAAEHHVLLRVRRAGKPFGRFIRAHQIIDRGGNDGRQPVAHDHHAQSVRQRRPQHAVLVSLWRRRNGRGRARNTQYTDQQEGATNGAECLMDHGGSEKTRGSGRVVGSCNSSPGPAAQSGRPIKLREPEPLLVLVTGLAGNCRLPGKSANRDE